MSNQLIEVNLRSELGSAASRRLRKEGLVPAVIYGSGKEATSVTINARDYKRTTTHAKKPLFQIKSSESVLNDLMVFVKDENIDPLKDQLLHVDLLAVEKGKEITFKVNVEVVGECAAIKQGAAVLNQTVYEIEVSCLPINIPSLITVDISNLKAGQAILAGELNLPDGVALKTAEDVAIVSAFVKRQSVEEDAGDSAEEGADKTEEASKSEGADK